MENYDKTFVILNRKVKIKKAGNKYLLIRPDFDYSKKNLISITNDSIHLLDFIRLQRSLAEVFNEFCKIPSEQKPYIDFIRYLSNEGYLTFWDMQIEGKQFVSGLAKNIWAPEHIPVDASIELTLRCNFNCIHCYLKENKDSNELTTPKITKIIDILHNAGMFLLTFTGGEPLLREDFAEIYLYAKSRGFLIEIFTNGYFLDEKLLNLFLEYPPLELDISMYGMSDEKYREVTGVSGAFSKIKKNIRLYKDSGINISLKSPIMYQLENDVEEMFSFATELGVDMRVRFDMIPTISNQNMTHLQMETKNAVELYAKFSNTYVIDVKNLLNHLNDPSLRLGKTRYACGLGKCSCFIDYLGRVHPCIETRPLGIGVSIFKHSFNEIWAKMGEYSYEQLTEKEVDDYKCLSCKCVSICPSCPVIRERKYGSPTIVKEEDCQYANELFEYILKHNTK